MVEDGFNGPFYGRVVSGKQFFKVCQDSKLEKRDLSGQTKSGMLVLYMPAYEGLDGFIGPYGESVIDTPTPQQAAFIGNSITTTGAQCFARSHVAINKLFRDFPFMV